MCFRPLYFIYCCTSIAIHSHAIRLLAGDALASPTHWFYGGKRQVISEYGHPITDYTKPNKQIDRVVDSYGSFSVYLAVVDETSWHI